MQDIVEKLINITELEDSIIEDDESFDTLQPVTDELKSI